MKNCNPILFWRLDCQHALAGAGGKCVAHAPGGLSRLAAFGYERGMSVWSRLAEFLSRTTVDAFSNIIESVRTVFEGDPETRRQVAFSIAMIALSAKMAKADGVVTPAEVRAFREIFKIPDGDATHVSRLYNLAKQDVAGFVSYARQVRDLFPGDRRILEDVLDGLFHIAKADGMVHEKEVAFLETVADTFGIDERGFARIKMRHMREDGGDPYEVMDAMPEWDGETLKSHYRKLVRENHPDRLIARGVPEEFVAIANGRLAAINRAWAQVRAERRL